MTVTRLLNVAYTLPRSFLSLSFILCFPSLFLADLSFPSFLFFPYLSLSFISFYRFVIEIQRLTLEELDVFGCYGDAVLSYHCVLPPGLHPNLSKEELHHEHPVLVLLHFNVKVHLIRWSGWMDGWMDG